MGLSTEAVVAICGVVLAALKVVEKIYDGWQLRKAAEKVSLKVEEVKVQAATDAADVKGVLATTDAEKKAHLDKQDEVLAEIKERTANLEAASFIAGIKSEKDRPPSPG